MNNCTLNVLIDIKTLPHYKDLPLPIRMTKSSAGIDLYAAIIEDILIKPMERMKIATGISVGIPEGYEIQIRPRSGLASNHGITIINTPGTIDADYRGEIFIPLINLGSDAFKVSRGMRIAQMVVAQYIFTSWNIVDSLEESERKGGGFGSTGY